MSFRGVPGLLMLLASLDVGRQQSIDLGEMVKARREREYIPIFAGGNGDRWSVPPHALHIVAARRRRSAQTHRRKRWRGGRA